MRSKNAFMITAVIIIVCVIGAWYWVSHPPAPNRSGTAHATITNDTYPFEFDYPTFEGWEATVDEGGEGITYAPTGFRKRSVPDTRIRIESWDYGVAPDWSGKPVNEFGAAYDLKRGSVEFDNGTGAGIRFVADINSARGALTPAITDSILLTIADSFRIVNPRANALALICTDRPYEISITEFSDAAGTVGGYVSTVSDPSVVMDAPAHVYDPSGRLIDTISLFDADEDRKESDELLMRLKTSFPNETSVSCVRAMFKDGPELL